MLTKIVRSKTEYIDFIFMLDYFNEIRNTPLRKQTQNKSFIYTFTAGIFIIAHLKLHFR